MKHLTRKNWGAVVDRYIREGRTVSGGSPVSQPTAQEIIAGPALLYIAPVGTAVPTGLSASPATWPPAWTGWTPLGYTDKGLDLIITPTIKPYTPDEERSPVYDIPQAEKVEISVVLAQTIIDNLSRAISASLLTSYAGKKRTLSFGNQPLQYYAIGAQGPSPVDPDGSGTNVGAGVVVIMQKAIAASPITFAATRQNVRLYNVKWEGRKIAGQDLVTIYDVIQ